MSNKIKKSKGSKNIKVKVISFVFSRPFWILVCFIITAIAAFLRFFRLDLKPLHHDEGVNGHFLIELFHEGIYRYNPANYHGPSLYYVSLAIVKVFGLNTIGIRLSVALFGILTVVLAFFLRKHLGDVGSLAAALFLALSPGMVYFSRYFIHEILLVFFSLSFVVAFVYFIEKRQAGVFSVIWTVLLLMVCFFPHANHAASYFSRKVTIPIWMTRFVTLTIVGIFIYFIIWRLLVWKNGQPIYFLLVSASLVLLFATKETSFITIGTILISCFCVWIWRDLYKKLIDKIPSDELSKKPLTLSSFRNAMGNSTELLLIMIMFASVFIYVGVLFFSSFFTYWEGVIEAFKAHAIWTKATVGVRHTKNGMLAYVKWLWQIESSLIILSLIGVILSFSKARHRFAIFTSFWTFGLFLAYTIIPYKTPWLTLSFILPMCLISGYAINELFASGVLMRQVAAGILTAGAVYTCSYQTYNLNFVGYDDDKLPYVYVHTQRGLVDLIKKIKRYAKKSGKKKNAAIEIVSPDYWPVPWYLREYSKVDFLGKLGDSNHAEMIVASEAQSSQLVSWYGAHYKYAGTYPLRPGINLILLVKKELADENAKEIGVKFY